MSDTTRMDPSSPEGPGARGASAAGSRRAPELRTDDPDALARDSESSSSDPIEMAKRPDNRAALALATAALTLLNLLLLIAVLANVVGDDYEAVVVEGEACVLEVAGDDSVLYCRR